MKRIPYHDAVQHLRATMKDCTKAMQASKQAEIEADRLRVESLKARQAYDKASDAMTPISSAYWERMEKIEQRKLRRAE